MTRFCLSALLLFISTSFVSAQFSKGTKTVGGSIGLSKSSQETTFGADGYNSTSKNFSISIKPVASYFIDERISIGLSINAEHFSTISENSAGESKTRIQGISGGPMLRYYFPLSPFAIFTLAGINFGYQHFETPFFDPQQGIVNNRKINGEILSYQLGIGGAYFINESVALEALLFHQKEKFAFDVNDWPEQKNSAIKLNLGFQIYLN